MSIETIPEIEYGLEVIENNLAYEDASTLTERVEQVEGERGRFMSYVGKLAGRAALVGAIVAGVFVGQGEAAEAAPAPTAPVACTKNGVQGMQLGQLCVTKQEVRQSGACSKADEIIGEVALAVVLRKIPVGGIVKDTAGYGWTLNSILRGGFCD
jgi:hypothetical protein